MRWVREWVPRIMIFLVSWILEPATSVRIPCQILAPDPDPTEAAAADEVPVLTILVGDEAIVEKEEELALAALSRNFSFFFLLSSSSSSSSSSPSLCSEWRGRQE